MFQHPLYTYSCPALLKEWLDRVLTRGFASGVGGDALAGKHWRSVITTGDAESAYQTSGALGVEMADILRPFMDLLGLSMALGTFIAGVLLAESEYRHELEIAIEPFKGLLLGLFFISVGMALNLGILYVHVLTVLAGVAILVAIKGTVLYILTRLSGLKLSVRLQFAGVLSQGGEFAFVLFSATSAQKSYRRSIIVIAGDFHIINDYHAVNDAIDRSYPGPARYCS